MGVTLSVQWHEKRRFGVPFLGKLLARCTAVAALAITAMMATVDVGRAQVWYTPYGRWTTEQTMYTAQCVRHDLYEGVGPCYNAVWSNSLAIGEHASMNDVVWQKSYGFFQDLVCYQGACAPSYEMFSSPEYRSGTYYTSDWLVHCCRTYVGAPVNIVGDAFHRNLTYSQYTYWYTSSWVEP